MHLKAFTTEIEYARQLVSSGDYALFKYCYEMIFSFYKVENDIVLLFSRTLKNVINEILTCIVDLNEFSGIFEILYIPFTEGVFSKMCS